MNKDRIEYLRKMYPEGTRIKINEMNDPYHPIPSGTLGTVDHVDDAGTIHMTWDNGQSLGLIDGEDDFTVVHRPEYKEEQIRVLVVAPLQKPVIKIIENTLEAQQEVVGGDIEYLYIDDQESIMVCNEEGKLRNLQANRRIGVDIIAGTFFIARDDGSEYLKSLTDEQIEKYKERFNEIEHIEQEEMMMYSGFIVRGYE